MARGATDSIRLIPRKIYFYGKQSSKEIDFPKLFATAASWSAVEQLILEVPGDDRRIVCRVDHKAWPVRLSLALVRMRNLPSLMKFNGDERDIDADEDEGVLDRTHFVFFKSGAVGCEMNIFGPRFESLFTHLSKLPKLHGMIGGQPPRFGLLLRDDALERMEGLDGITLLRIRAFRNVGNRNSDTLSKQMAEIAKLTDADTIELILRSQPRSKTGLWSSCLFSTPEIGLIIWLGSSFNDQSFGSPRSVKVRTLFVTVPALACYDLHAPQEAFPSNR